MKNPWRLIGYAICGIVGIWLTVKLFLPVGLPFLLGFGLSALAESPVRALKERVGIKKTIRDYGIDEADFLNRLDAMVEQAFDDQCTGANPLYPLMSEIKQMYRNAYYGTQETV